MDHNDERDFDEERDVRESLEREGREELDAEHAAAVNYATTGRRPGDTSAARAANVRRGLERKASDLRAAGFLVVTPEHADEAAGYLPRGLWRDVDLARGVERHEFGEVPAKWSHGDVGGGVCVCGRPVGHTP